MFVQANIHAGEVEGKEASLILARRLGNGDLRPLLKQLVILIAPIYNADGNERVSVQNRTAQNGPVAGVGTRENAKGLDLNRDYMKLDCRRGARARRADEPLGSACVVDLHTTNGSYHGYHLTYSPSLNPNADARLIALARDRILPAMRAGGAEEAQLPHLLLRQLRLRVGHRPRDLAGRSREPGRHDLANVRSSPALRQQLRRPAQSPGDSLGGVQLSRFPWPRARHRSVRRGNAAARSLPMPRE